MLQNKLKSFLLANANSPIQKSAKWKEIKSTTIGGSEVATVLGRNPFKSPASLVAEKTNLGMQFNGNIATRWGNLCEPITKLYTENIFNTIIYDTGSIKGPIDRQRYSPDGLGIVNLLDVEDNPEQYIALFEFKAPYSSIPNKKIPKHYIPQLQTGLITIGIAEFAIFVNNSYRKCPIKDLNFNLTYDTVFHKDTTKKLTKAQQISQVYACGLIQFYQTKSHYENYVKYCGYNSDDSEEEDTNTEYFSYNSNDVSLLLNSEVKPIDFGYEPDHMMARLLELVDEGRVIAVYSDVLLNEEVINEMDVLVAHNLQKETSYLNPKKTLIRTYNEFLATCDKNNWVPVGYMPWKLIKSDIIFETREEGWQQFIDEKISDILKKIDTIAASDDKQQTYDEIFNLETIISDEEAFSDMAKLNTDSE